MQSSKDVIEIDNYVILNTSQNFDSENILFLSKNLD